MFLNGCKEELSMGQVVRKVSSEDCSVCGDGIYSAAYYLLLSLRRSLEITRK